MIEYNNPVIVEFGKGSLNFLKRFVKDDKVLLLTSPTFVKNNTVKKIQEMVNVVQVINNIKPNPTIEYIESLRLKIDYSTFDKVVALGGGSVIDTAKAISPHNFEDNTTFLNVLINGFDKVECEFKSIIAIPTTAGTGSEVTMWGTIWDKRNNLKYSIAHPNLYCEAAILDPNLHVTLPKNLTIQTGLDALSHSLESLWNKNVNPISEKYAISAIQIIVESLPKLVDDLTNIQLRENLLLASYRAGLAFSNTQTAIAHAMSYYMTLNKGIPHGIAASFTLPIITKVAMKNAEISIKLKSALGENPVQTLNDFLKSLDVSTNSHVYNLTNKDWENILKSLENTSRIKNSKVDAKEVISLLTKEG